MVIDRSSESLGEGEAEVRFGRPWMSREEPDAKSILGVGLGRSSPFSVLPWEPGGGPELTERNKLANVPGYLSAKVVSIADRSNLRCQKILFHLLEPRPHGVSVGPGCLAQGQGLSSGARLPAASQQAAPTALECDSLGGGHRGHSWHS